MSHRSDDQTLGSTSALASFSGPIEVRLREELVDRATLEIVHRPLEGVGGMSSLSRFPPTRMSHKI